MLLPCTLGLNDYSIYLLSSVAAPTNVLFNYKDCSYLSKEPFSWANSGHQKQILDSLNYIQVYPPTLNEVHWGSRRYLKPSNDPPVQSQFAANTFTARLTSAFAGRTAIPTPDIVIDKCHRLFTSIHAIATVNVNIGPIVNPLLILQSLSFSCGTPSCRFASI